MPITRRKRANPPDQPENNSSNPADPSENSTETPTAERPASASAAPVETEHPVDSAPIAPTRPEPIPFQPSAPTAPPAPTAPTHSPGLPASLTAAINGERSEFTPIESGRRTARGELFRRPPQPPPLTPPLIPAAPPTPPPLQPPTHEIKLPLGREPGDTRGDPLHLAYNPGYTGADEARGILLQKLANESKAGGRGRCWNCGSLAIAYDRWSTRSKTFGEIGIAFCEICGVWSVM